MYKQALIKLEKIKYQHFLHENMFENFQYWISTLLFLDEGLKIDYKLK